MNVANMGRVVFVPFLFAFLYFMISTIIADWALSRERKKNMAENNMENTGNQENGQAGQEKTFTQDEVNRIVQDRLARAKHEAETADSYKRERDDAIRKLEEYENNAFLKEKGVREADMDYISFKAGQMVNDKMDFKAAAEQFLKQNPRFTGPVYRVTTSTQSSGGSAEDSDIRKAMGLKG